MDDRKFDVEMSSLLVKDISIFCPPDHYMSPDTPPLTIMPSITPMPHLTSHNITITHHTLLSHPQLTERKSP